jgi:hypothetical protein
VYAVAAIWTNLELFLGIIAANLALSRSMYTFFRYGKKSSQVPTPAVPTAGAFSVQVNTAHSDDVDVEKESSSMRSGTKPSLQTLTQQNSGTSD